MSTIASHLHSLNLQILPFSLLIYYFWDCTSTPRDGVEIFWGKLGGQPEGDGRVRNEATETARVDHRSSLASTGGGSRQKNLVEVNKEEAGPIQ